MWTRSFAFVSILSFSSAARFSDSGRLFAISRRQPLETETTATSAPPQARLRAVIIYD